MYDISILIIEDESLIALALKKIILSFGYKTVRYATHPKKALTIMQENEINLILMDINLKSNITGIDLYKRFKTKIPVIYLTAYNDEDTIEKAIATNPIGYMIKPYKKDDLKALLLLSIYKLNHLEYTALPSNDLLALGEGYRFNTSNNKLYFDNIYIKLGKKEIKLIKLLIAAKGFIVDYSTIEYELWENGIVSDSAMRTLVYRLRGKLDYKLIESIPNQGLKINFS